MFITGEEKEQAREIIKRSNFSGRMEGSIGMHLGANVLLNRWPVERFAELSDYLTGELKMKVIVFYGLKEQGLASQFKKLVKNQVLIQEPLPLRQFAALLSLLDVFVCNDTGVLHVAAAVGVKTVAVFGPTDPKQWNPLGNKHLWVRNIDESVFSVTLNQIILKIEELLRLRP